MKIRIASRRGSSTKRTKATRRQAGETATSKREVDGGTERGKGWYGPCSKCTGQGDHTKKEKRERGNIGPVEGRTNKNKGGKWLLKFLA